MESATLGDTESICEPDDRGIYQDQGPIIGICQKIDNFFFSQKLYQ